MPRVRALWGDAVIGRRVKARGEAGVVTVWKPLGASMCDVLILFDDGRICWFASHELHPIDGDGPLPLRREAQEQARITAIASLREIRRQHVRDFRNPWPGAEHGKVIVGRAIDGALADLGADGVKL